MNKLLPIFMDLAEKKCLIVGAGKVAWQKIQQLLAAEAQVTVIAPQQLAEIKALAGVITLVSREYQEGDVTGFFMVIGATANAELNAAISAQAKAQQIPVNIVDTPQECDFYFGSVYQNADLKIAISSNGKCPSLTKYIRDTIAATYAKFAELLPQLAEERQQLDNIKTNYSQRKTIMRDKVAAAVQAQSLKEHGFSTGSVVLVGAGPGHEDLITLRGQKAISLADVILYDALVNPAILKHARDNAEIVYVGKQAGHCNAYKQADINALMIKHAQQNKLVIRLKGGDPFVFGRGGEEMEALVAANIQFQVIPGVSAIFGACAATGIPLTHREHNSSFAVVTAHLTDDQTIDWAAIWHLHKTIAIYMGVKALAEIVAQLSQANCPLSTPIALIEKATLCQQKIIIGTLKDICTQAQAQQFAAPGLILIGENVHLHAKVAQHLSFN